MEDQELKEKALDKLKHCYEIRKEIKFISNYDICIISNYIIIPYIEISKEILFIDVYKINYIIDLYKEALNEYNNYQDRDKEDSDIERFMERDLDLISKEYKYCPHIHCINEMILDIVKPTSERLLERAW